MDATTSKQVPISKRTLILMLAVVLVPVVFVLLILFVAPMGGTPEVKYSHVSFARSKLPLVKQILGAKPKFPQRNTHVQIVDFDADSLPDVITCDARLGQIIWHHQNARGHWEDIILNPKQVFAAPVHTIVGKSPLHRFDSQRLRW